MNATQAWEQLQALVKAEAENWKGAQQPSFHWSRNGRLALMGTWQVEAAFVEGGRDCFLIQFDRFGAQLGTANCELPLGVKTIELEVWRLEFISGSTTPFWQLRGQALSPERLARKIVEYLTEYYEKVKLAAMGIV